MTTFAEKEREELAALFDEFEKIHPDQLRNIGLDFFLENPDIQVLLKGFGGMLETLQEIQKRERQNAEREMALALCPDRFEQVPATGIAECFPERTMRIDPTMKFHQRDGEFSFVPTKTSTLFPLGVMDVSCSTHEMSGRLEIREYHTDSWDRIFRDDECDFSFWTPDHSLWQRIVSGSGTGYLFFSQSPEYRFPIRFGRESACFGETPQTTLARFFCLPELEMFFRFTPDSKGGFLRHNQKASRDESLVFVWEIATGRAIKELDLKLNCLGVDAADVDETLVLRRDKRDYSFVFPRNSNPVRRVRHVFNEDRTVEYIPFTGRSNGRNRRPGWFVSGSNLDELILRFEDGAEVPEKIIVDVDTICLQPFSERVVLKSGQGNFDVEFRIGPGHFSPSSMSVPGLDELLLSRNLGPFFFTGLNVDSLRHRIGMDDFAGNSNDSLAEIKAALSSLREVKQEYIDRRGLPESIFSGFEGKPLPCRGRKITLVFDEANNRILPWQFLLSSLLNRLFFQWTSPELFSFTVTMIHPNSETFPWTIY